MMNRRNSNYRPYAGLIGLLVLLFPLLLAARPVTEKQSLFDILEHKTMLKVTLEMDLEAVLGNRRNTAEHPAVFSFTDAEGGLQEWNTKVKLRGKFRRVKCEAMPPLKLNFKKGDLKAAGLAKFDDFKLVTHCVADDRQARELLLKEYLAYKLYHQLTEESFRVQFLQITYRDSKSGSKDTQWGFLIEDTAQLRARLGAEKWENPLGIDSVYLDAKQLQRVALFQYMIGNMDWSIRAARNIKVMERDGMALIVPYDFDFSAFVDAPYRVVDTSHSVDGTTGEHQAYLTSMADRESLEPAWSQFVTEKEAMLELIKDCKMLRFSERRHLMQFIQTFFDRVETQQSVVLR